MVQSASTNDARAAPREVGGANDVTVSNRVNLVDPIRVHSNAFRPQFLDYWGCGAIANKALYLHNEAHDRSRT